MENFREKFEILLMDKLGVSGKDIRSDAKFSDLGADSLDMIELIVEFEKTFEITIHDEDVEMIITVGDAEDYLVAPYE